MNQPMKILDCETYDDAMRLCLASGPCKVVVLSLPLPTLIERTSAGGDQVEKIPSLIDPGTGFCTLKDGTLVTAKLTGAPIERSLGVYVFDAFITTVIDY